MPQIKIQHISTFSSEDANHPARNLLSSDTYRKWKCASAGEKQTVVVLQLETPVQINGLDIGNEGSAFVEVLVGRSSSNDDYKVLLVASSFMSPADSKAWTNTNRVRMFGSEKLSKGVAEQRWDQVKVVCTQPYNKKEQYGLSFINLHSPGESSTQQEGEKTTPTTPCLGAFSLKEEPKSLPSGSLFYKKEPVLSPAGSSSAAAQARSASAAALRTNDSQPSPRKKQSSKGHRGEGESGSKTSKTISAGDQGSAKPQKKTKVSSPSKAKESKSNIMSGVVFSLSGFKNPFRTELREKAVEMGGAFQPDWNPSCTHLVCAFPNTPKFNQVKAKHGLIVKKEWILDCHVKKKRLPASKYRLSGGGGDSSSEDEFYDNRERDLFGGQESVVGTASGKTVSSRGEVSGGGSVVGVKRGREREAVKDEDLYGGSTDEAEDMETDAVVKKKPLPRHSSSECDAEDEIQRIKAEQDIYAGTTETESDDDENDTKPEVSSLTSLPDLFSHSHFMLYGTFSPADRRLVQRYIIAYSGHIEDYMSEKVSYVVTLEDWDANFDQALEDNSSLIFVRPQWIFKCHEKQSCLPHQPYVVVPS